MITIVVPTYKRNKYLTELIERLAKYSELLTFEIELYIYDNDPQNDFENNILRYNSKNLSINYKKRDINHGPVFNFWYSLKDSLSTNSKYISIITDDDLVYSDYLIELNKIEISSSKDFILFNNLILYNELKQKFSISNIKNEYIEILDNHRTIIGSTYSKSFLIDFFKLYEKDFEKVLMKSWYPMTFLTSHTTNVGVVETPCLVHTVDNKIFWDYSHHYQRFYHDRIELYRIASKNNKLSDVNKNIVINKLIKRNGFSYLIRYLITTRFKNYSLVLLIPKTIISSLKIFMKKLLGKIYLIINI
jgi:hypothetical protein